MAVLALALLLPTLAATSGRAEENPAVIAALDRLADGDVEARLAAIEVLDGAGGGRKIERALRHALKDEDWGVVIRAAEALGRIGGRTTRQALVRLATEGEILWVREAAVRGLRDAGAEEATKSLLHVASASSREEVKARALAAVAELGCAEDVQKVRGFLRAREGATAAAAVRALGRLGKDPEQVRQVVTDLGRLLANRDRRSAFDVYAAAVQALAGIDDPQARKLVVEEILQQPDEDPYVTMRATRALAEQPAAAMDELLEDVLAHAKKQEPLRRIVRLCGALRPESARKRLEALARSNRASVRLEAVRTLGRMAPRKTSSAVVLRALRSRDARVRVEAVTALARCLPAESFHKLSDEIREDRDPEVRVQYVVELTDAGDPAGIDALALFLDDRDWRPATAAAAAIGTLGVEADMGRLEPCLETQDWKLRAAAYEGLGRLRTAAAIPHLVDGLSDHDPVVRDVCHANLEILMGVHLAPEPARWRAWWEEHRKDLKLLKRSRRTKEEKEEEARQREHAYYAHEFPRWKEHTLEVLKNARLLVTIGAWDHVEKVLDHLDIPCTVLRAQELKEHGVDPNQIIMVNCEGTQDAGGREVLQWFVNVGGYLLTTDWALVNTVEPCFPGHIARYQGFTTGNDVVVVEEAQPGHPWTRGIFEGVPGLDWWLEVQAFPMIVTRPERVDVLVDSAEMRRKYGASPLAATFRYGLGKVQHSVSHFFLQEEGMTKESDPRQRMVYAADHLGIPLVEIRRLAAEGVLKGSLNDEAMREIAPHYSMFRLIVNAIEEKEAWVRDL